MQNFSVFVCSRAVLNPPQNSTPATKPPRVRKPSDSLTGGRVTVCTHGFSQNQDHAFAIAAISAPPRLAFDERVHVDEVVRHEGTGAGLRHMAGEASVAARRDATQ